MRTFASDNNSGIHPKALAAIAAANEGHARAYGEDEWTQRATRRLAAMFPGAEAFLAFNGTGANVLGLSAMTRPFDAVLCAEGAHVAVDECNAPERFTGCKLVTIPTPDGKLTPALLEPHIKGVGVEHHAQPRVVSITQATELGTVYAPREVRALADFCHARGMLLHMDGARFANAVASIAAMRGRDLSAPLGADAAASLGVAPREAADGVDVLTFGGTKNGMMAGEAVVFLRPELARDFRFVRKQGMQLASKMRFLAAQMDAMLDGDAWLDAARHANAMARLLSDEAAKVPGVEIVHPTQANEVFARLPRDAIAPLQKERFFYIWDEPTDVVRWVCSWDTTEDDVRAFVAAMRRVVEQLTPRRRERGK